MEITSFERWIARAAQQREENELYEQAQETETVRYHVNDRM